VFIWDLQNPTAPTVYSPGTTGQQMADIMSVQWNRKVVHILATATHSGNTVIWDLRAKRPVITFGDASRRIRCRAIAWAPDHPTTIITASEEDEFPNINVWNLKNTYAPERVRLGILQLFPVTFKLFTIFSVFLDTPRPQGRNFILVMV